MQPSTMRRPDTVLVANRGEIAVRVIRTLRRLGIHSVAVHSDADTHARHVTEADTAIRIGPRNAAESYLSVERILDAAQRSGAQAIHPGYGFLSENAAFARACAASGIAFIGPSPEAIDAMGDKIRAKQTVRDAGVPLVPGRSDPGMSDADVREAALEAGLPVLLKPSAGGGGKGMRAVADHSALDEQITSARREARAAFGDDTLLVERYVTRPRHIEVQILADTHGNVVHLGERECSLQRRHQKIIEEAPSALLDGDTRRRIGAAAVEAARSVGYVGAGTVEFIVSAEKPEEFFFMEMNTRLQVEHPVTELVTSVGGQRGIDLVEWQVRVASGEVLPFTQDDLALDGHAVEARVYAEDPARNFLPTGGTLLAVHEPSGPGVRVDSGVTAGTEVGSDYDPMLAKVIGRGTDRPEALRRLDAALADTAILGIGSNIAFLRALLGHPEVREGTLDTGLVERDLESLVAANRTPPDEIYIAAALQRLLASEPDGPVVDPWDVPGGWRMGKPAWSVWRFAASGEEREVRIRGRAADADVSVCSPPREATQGESEPAGTAPPPSRASVHADGDLLTVTVDGRTRRYRYAHADGITWLAVDGQAWALTEHRLLADRADSAAGSGGVVTSPMPGTVLVADVEPGQQVRVGQTLFVVEAMKMEHTITASVDGTVTEVHATKGQSVGLDQTLAVLSEE
ncbi:acetyl-CoA/propionyl-CoA carboxylase biotin carboxyl carrier protein [Halopolyspora algeriensis]|uniref:Biotin-dependent 3-methylcrotonyl-coenzyme A carboxylase alpha1 subunit n=1 Tax=Halopolyspora algeriensis TaxID=1500506 RepID=A0A368VZW7_9ACTN|nr:acetyl/propionyl/methylcrotonyl-CoA carboxylase subunit alpha [Halopolyspora algeriensis]RCW46979.1 acetyl-CoA/propionyl-CoA carboxylase biotin carboxyl carrier protein [Halopolyspora algeriensis]TQM48068.1 acetyl-CoA/propionyl-CoA carboxylase biotin carboxyl carrier protein [Halopolyspora algeriensis]